MKQALHLIPRPHPRRDADAWFIPVADPAVWLTIIADAGQALHDVEVRVVPRSTSDRSPLGALLCAPGWRTQPTPLAQPYGRIAGRLFLPTHAEMIPPLSDSELAAKLMTASAVFHPVVGLVGFEEADVFSALSLVRAPEPRPSAWTMPEPGPEVVRRLHALEPIMTLSIEDVENQLGEGFDQRPLDELPPAPGEKGKGPIGKAGSSAVSGIAGVTAWLTSKAPGTASSRTWIDSLHDWATSRQARPGQADQEKRNREINRLLDMLKKSPELGLSFAIPMSGLSLARGMGFGGNELTRRSTGFSLGGLFGGGAADPWEIAHEQQQALIRRYRELAVEEAQQGRYRRAAYIYASLLGDIEASARVLEEGGHYDEAAVILRDKLKQPIAAARCLERGGRLTEAIALFLENNHWVDAAKLYERLDQWDEAHRWYRHAAQQMVEARDFIKAALLLEEKLSDIDEAERVLDLGWKPPNTDWACVSRRFELTGRHGRHDSALEVLDELVRVSPGAERAGRLAKTLSTIRSTYPDPAICQAMSALVMRLAGEHLPSIRVPSRARAFTDAVGSLAPDDRLLVRDTRRYISLLSRTIPGKTPAKRTSQSVLSLGTKAVVPTGRWFRMFASRHAVHLIGSIVNHGEQLYVTAITGLEQGKPKVRTAPINQAHWDPDRPFAEQVVCEHVSGPSDFPPYLFMSFLGGPAIPAQVPLRSDNDSRLFIGHQERWPASTLAVSSVMPGQTWVLSGTVADSPELVLNAYSRKMQLIQSIPVVLSEEQIETFHVLDRMGAPPAFCLHGRKDYVVLTIGTVQIKFAGGVQLENEIRSAPVVGIRGAVPFGRARYALFHQQGVCMVWDQPGRERAEQKALSAVDQPVGALTHTSGLLAVAHARGCQLFSTTEYGELRPVDEIRWPDRFMHRPTDLVPLGNRDDFAVLFEDGTVQVCNVNPPPGRRY